MCILKTLLKWRKSQICMNRVFQSGNGAQPQMPTWSRYVTRWVTHASEGSSVTGVGGSGRLEARAQSKVTAATTQHQLITVMKEYGQTQGCQDLEQNPSFRRHISLVHFPHPSQAPQKHCEKYMSENQLWSVGLGWPEDHQIVTSDLRWLLASIVFQKELCFIGRPILTA